jgi:pyruvate ferredoxin oxidoreductase gamma subunit
MAYLLAMAGHAEGYEAQAFPHFGVERRGAPVAAYVRFSKNPIRLREHVYHPEVIIIQDPSLIGSVDILQGAHKDTKIIVNTEKSIKDLGLPKNYKVLTVPAAKIAMETIGQPIINTVMLGAFGGVFSMLKFASIRAAICQNFSEDLAKVNVKAANTAYCHTQSGNKYCQLTPNVCSISNDDVNKLKVQC